MKNLFYFSILFSRIVFGQTCSADITISSANYAINLTQSSTYISINSSIDVGKIIKLDANPTDGYVLMNPGFIVSPSSAGAFIAQPLDGCGNAIPNKIASVNANENSKDIINLYPNPASDVVNISFGKKITEVFSVLLYDTSGKLKFNKKMKTGNGKTYSIVISSLVTGSYIYKIKANDHIKTGIIIKK